jgi:uncharacterized membrane protein
MTASSVHLQKYPESPMDKDKVGALIDGVYAIALTLLVLELPNPEATTGVRELIQESSRLLMDYALAFIILFAFWYNQRRINDLVVSHRRITLWLNGLTLMMVCLLPFTTTLLYNFGQQKSWLGQFNQAALVDIVFIAVCLSIDGLIHLILAVIHHSQSYSQEHHQKVAQVVQSRRIATMVLIVAMFASFALPIPNRISLVIIPLILMFEVEVAVHLSKAWRRLRKNNL